MADQDWEGGELLFAGGTDFFAVCFADRGNCIQSKGWIYQPRKPEAFESFNHNRDEGVRWISVQEGLLCAHKTLFLIFR